MKKEINTLGYTLIFSLLITLVIAAYLSFKSIDYKILDRLEATPNLPAPSTATTPAIIPSDTSDKIPSDTSIDTIPPVTTPSIQPK